MIEHQLINSYGNYSYNAFVYTYLKLPQHFHRNYELIYAISGLTEVTNNGFCETLSEGDLLLIGPYNIHALNTKENAKVWVGVFSSDYITSFSSSNGHANFSKFRCSKQIDDFLKENLFYEGKPRHYLLMSCLYMACSECINNSVSHNITQEDKLIRKIVEYVSENFQDNITLNEIAKALNYEYHYFSSLFNKNFNMNFKTFLNILRFDEACSLLSDKNNDISYISDACGFGSIRNFNRIFKQLSGLSPSQYRTFLSKH